MGVRFWGAKPAGKLEVTSVNQSVNNTDNGLGP